MAEPSADLKRIIEEIRNYEEQLEHEHDPEWIEEIKKALILLYVEFYEETDEQEPADFGLKGKPTR